VILKAIKGRLREDKTVLLRVKVIPKSGRTCFAGEMEDGSIKIKVAAVPEQGKANAELVSWLAEYFEVPKANVEIVSGATAPRKLVRVTV
jgi:uncharacterized protein